MNTEEESGSVFFMLQGFIHVDPRVSCPSVPSRCQRTREQLEAEKKDLTTQLRVLDGQKKDIVDYLKRALLEKEEEVDELTERLERQRQAADEDREAQQMLHHGRMQELQSRVHELTTENRTLGEKCSKVYVCLRFKCIASLLFFSSQIMNCIIRCVEV